MAIACWPYGEKLITLINTHLPTVTLPEPATLELFLTAIGHLTNQETLGKGVLTKELLHISLSRLEARLLDDAVFPLVETLIKNNGGTGHLRTLVRLLLKMMGELRVESKCEK